MLEKWQCVVCCCVPWPDEVVQCSACDSLFCSVKSAELKVSCPHCELTSRSGMQYGFSVTKVTNRLVTDCLNALRLKCQFCDTVLKLEDYKNHLRLKHTLLTCQTPMCNEPIEEGTHCNKTACVLVSKWLDVLRAKQCAVNPPDAQTVKAIEFTTQTVNNLSARIEDMKMQIDQHHYKAKADRHVSFNDFSTFERMGNHASTSCNFKKTKSFDTNLFKLGQ